jgi:hypothetical protein
MSIAVGVKVVFELVACVGVLVFIVGLALRGRARDTAISWGAAFVGFSGLVILLEALFGLLDANRIPSAIIMVLFGAGTAAGVVYSSRLRRDA